MPYQMQPHMMRHGGPSHDLYSGASSRPDIQTRGRWLCLESTRRYAKPAGMLRTKATLSDLEISEAERYSRTLPKLLVERIS